MGLVGVTFGHPSQRYTYKGGGFNRLAARTITRDLKRGTSDAKKKLFCVNILSGMSSGNITMG